MKRDAGKNGHSPLPLPGPGSNAELDKKILAYARARTPQPAARQPQRWLAGLATASIVAVAVLIALPGQQPATVRPVPRPQSSPEMAPAPAPAASAGALSDRQQMNIMPAPLRSESLSGEREARKERPVSAASDAASPAAALADQDIAVASTYTLNTQEIRQRLQELLRRLHSGDAHAARADYQLLREQCPGCDLPPELEQAITIHLAPRRNPAND